MASFVKTFDINRHGRDFVVGDIHGMFALLDQALKEVNFNPSRDRLFSVGDLIDRGPASERCLDYLSEPWFHPVRGNHENFFLRLFADGKFDEELFNKGREYGVVWIKDADPQILARIYQALAPLPLVIEVPTPRGLVGIIHAQVPPGISWSDFTKRMKDKDQEASEYALEMREKIESRNQDNIPGVWRVYVGHTIQRGGPRRYGNLFAIDTGAFFGRYPYGLTMTNILVPQDVLCNSRDPGRNVHVYEDVMPAPPKALPRRSAAGLTPQ